MDQMKNTHGTLTSALIIALFLGFALLFARFVSEEFGMAFLPTLGLILTIEGILIAYFVESGYTITNQSISVSKGGSGGKGGSSLFGSAGGGGGGGGAGPVMPPLLQHIIDTDGRQEISIDGDRYVIDKLEDNKNRTNWQNPITSIFYTIRSPEFSILDATALSLTSSIRWVFGGMAGGIMATIILADISTQYIYGWAIGLILFTFVIELLLRVAAANEEI